MERQVVTLLAEAGRQWDEKKEAIGTHGRSIVFLPRGVNPGEKVRVELEEVRADARGRMMYRGRPAPVQSVERWVERDGKIERIELSVDWKFQETELRVLESRPIVRRDGEAHKSSTFVVDWGMSLQTARVTVTTKTEIHELEERIEVSYAAPYQKTMARRDGGTVTETFAVEGIEPIRSGYCEANDWRYNRLRAEYVGEPELYVRFKLAYDGDKSMETPSAIKWPDLPVWVQDYLSALNPVCGCGRERVDAASTQTVCSFCRREAQFEQSFPIARREALAAQAAKLAVVEPVPQETGEIILRSVFDHVAHSWSTNRDLLAEKSAGYAWYYFVGDGVYGSKFPPAALQVLAHLALASGAALQELAGWIAGPHKPNPHALREYEQSYYIKTQVRGEAAEYEPSVSTGELETMVVAVRLCGSMADRSAALDGFERAKASLGASDAMILEIDRILQGADQDFGLALSKLREIETVLAAQERGEILVNFGGYFRRMGATGNADSWVISPDGSRREPDQKEGRRRYEESEGSKYWHIVGTDELAISWSKANTAASHEFVVNKRPVRGLTAQQLATVEAIEEEILGSYYGMSMSGETMSPSLGRGWGFGSGTVERRVTRREQAVRNDTPAQPAKQAEPVDLSKVDLSGLFGGGAKQRR